MYCAASTNNGRKDVQMSANKSAIDDGNRNDLKRKLPSDSERRAVARLEKVSRSKFYSKGTVLFYEGQAAQGVYLLGTGRAKISIASAEGKKLIIRITGPGNILGLYAGLTGRACQATAEMVEAGHVSFVSRPDLLEIAGEETFGLDLVEVFSEHFREFVDHARLLMLSESALERLARLILKWSWDFGERTSGGIKMQIFLTQEEIAQILGASRETVTRNLSALKRRQIIGVKGDAIIIRNRNALASLAQLS
jgi:CRP/FNR family transcriptional regulator, cyclic AMP receptor protein